MNGKQHYTLGLAAGTAAAIYMIQNEIPVSMAIGSCCLTVFGEIYPDIDLPTSMIGRIVKPLSKLLNRIFGHRGFIHTPVNGILLGVLLWFVLSYITEYALLLAGSFLIGFMLHLLQDTVTKGGIMWLWPVSRSTIHFTQTKNGSAFCWIITVVFSVLVMFYPVYLFLSTNLPI